MGFSERNLTEFKTILQKPYGICLVVGPTGSGKTTTLHSGLGFINTEDMKIWTAEDPVEITQPGLRQVQVHPKIDFTFAAAMRSFLRADPDVIMVGEMRDHETAATGIEASLTGHLVFSTLHTNSAPETIMRLLDMDIDPFNFADALLGILAQRLVRTLCKACKEEYAPTQEEFAELMEEYGVEHWDKLGLSLLPVASASTARRAARSAATRGYKGRMGIHELLVATDEIKRMIQKRAPVEELRKQAIQEGMTTLLQDGIQKVLRGAHGLQAGPRRLHQVGGEMANWMGGSAPAMANQIADGYILLSASNLKGFLPPDLTIAPDGAGEDRSGPCGRRSRPRTTPLAQRTRNHKISRISWALQVIQNQLSTR